MSKDSGVVAKDANDELVIEHQFRHIPLVEPSKEIRLLSVEPGSSDDDEIRCSLSVRRFDPRWIKTIATGDAGFEYNAISYTWGEQHRSHRIWIDSKWLLVTHNCRYALWQARMHQNLYGPCIWIDAICIDQDNDEEKSQQVAMMSSIYACALHTLISLGKHKDDSEYLFEQLADPALTPFRPTGSTSVQRASADGETERLFEATAAFYTRP